MRSLLCSCLTAASFLSGPLQATESSTGTATPARDAARTPPSIEATALPAGATAIQIDGALTEDLWTKTPAVPEFLQRDPNEGAAATHRTEVRVVFDDTALYVAVRADEPEPAKIRGLLTRRDENS